MGTKDQPVRMEAAFHLCLDMQRLFSPDGPWPTPWMARVLPALAELFGERTVFTRFIPALDPEAEIGIWRGDYRRWAHLTLERIDPAQISLIDELQGFVPPAHIVDKRRFWPSPLPISRRSSTATASIRW